MVDSKKMKLLLIALILCPSLALSGHLHPEKYYQNLWCEKVGGITEYVLDDGTRVDCLTDEYAIEFDFAPKWAESIGQALYYAEKTGKKPGIVLIMENEGDERYLERVEFLGAKYHLKVWPL